jgi:mono/diheme cytochrome c family protein
MKPSSHFKLAAIFVTFACVAFALVQEPVKANRNVLQTPDAANVTRELYDTKCAKCHGKDGRAKTFAGRLKDARNLADDRWQDRVSDERILESIRDGRSEMPAFGKKLTEPQLESLVSFVRSFKGSRQSSGSN